MTLLGQNEAIEEADRQREAVGQRLREEREELDERLREFRLQELNAGADEGRVAGLAWQKPDGEHRTRGSSVVDSRCQSEWRCAGEEGGEAGAGMLQLQA